jgi:hypothetical protein
MDTLDLHGVRHYQVDRLVENFVLTNDLPVLIVTGNSPEMIALVDAVLERHNLVSEPENFWNLGAFVINEN